jgi:hypothetical protein
MRVGIKWTKFKMDLLAKLGLCKHDGSAGEVGAKKHYCLACGKEVDNPDWEDEREFLNNPKT